MLVSSRVDKVFCQKARASGTTKDCFSGQFFLYFDIIIFCFVVAICDLVHDVEPIFYLP